MRPPLAARRSSKARLDTQLPGPHPEWAAGAVTWVHVRHSLPCRRAPGTTAHETPHRLRYPHEAAVQVTYARHAPKCDRRHAGGTNQGEEQCVDAVTLVIQAARLTRTCSAPALAARLQPTSGRAADPCWITPACTAHRHPVWAGHPDRWSCWAPALGY